MKSVAKCIGCGRPRLVNEMDLCKRCSRHTFDFLTNEEIERFRLQHEALLEAKAKKVEKKAEVKDGATDAEGAEVEGEEESTGEAGTEAGNDKDSN